jgi:hypothetical protein
MATKSLAWVGPERRQPLTEPEAKIWRNFGFGMVYRGVRPSPLRTPVGAH